MEPRIEVIHSRKMIGMTLEMSVARNQSAELWKGFMQRRKEIRNCVSTNLYSIQKYDPDFDFSNFDFHRIFRKYAAVEVAEIDNTPEGMIGFELKGGKYAVFLHIGGPAKGEEIFRYIFTEWLPSSGYKVDNTRPHFEVLGEKYKNDHPESEEEIWIPIE